MDLEKYLIPSYAFEEVSQQDHLKNSEVATEGFFTKDKNPVSKWSNATKRDGSTDPYFKRYQYKKSAYIQAPTEKYAEDYARGIKRITKPFLSSGLKSMSSYIKICEDALEWVNKNFKRISDAYNFNKSECPKIGDEFNKIVSEFKQDNLAKNESGNDPWSGEWTDLPESARKQVYDILKRMVSVATASAEKCQDVRVKFYNSQSMLSKAFKGVSLLTTAEALAYFYHEVYLYCNDISIAFNKHTSFN